MSREVTVAKATDLPPGRGIVAIVEGMELAVFNVDGEFYVLDNACVHRGGPLGEGLLEGKVVTCPWHGWEYDLRSGENTFDPSVKVRAYPVKLVEGEVRVLL